MRTIVIGLLAGMALVGCAREDRWTLTGDRPSPLVDRPTHGETLKMSEVPVSTIPVVERDGALYIRNTDSKRNLLVTIQLTPADARPAVYESKQREVLVPADSEMSAGLLSDRAGTTYKYRVISARYR